MYFLRFRQVALRWDLPERYMAGFGVTLITLLAILSGIAQQVGERFSSSYDLEPPGGIFGNLGLGTIAVIYLAYMIGTGLFLAASPNENKATCWMIITGFVSFVILCIGGAWFSAGVGLCRMTVM